MMTWKKHIWMFNTEQYEQLVLLYFKQILRISNMATCLLDQIKQVLLMYSSGI